MDQDLLTGDHGLRLMVLRPLRINVAALNLSGARRELADHIRYRSDGLSRLWGYFPDLGESINQYPQSKKLADDLTYQVLQEAGEPVPAALLRLAFIRLAVGEPQSSVGGMHVDVHAGVNHHWPQDIPSDWHIIRLLLNLGPTPRRLEYSSITIDRLREQHGMAISRTHYEPLDLPTGVPLRHVDIPPLDRNTVWCLRFVSSLIPHAGRTDGRGHFLASYGGYLAPGLLPTI
ncbi:MAG TPA: hypothetical protein VFC19_01475 [Candidatus Limnocylindrales bacterium]|nr:hypothetical protein [Candidatus Limnocylindrales bacterium]